VRVRKRDHVERTARFGRYGQQTDDKRRSKSSRRRDGRCLSVDVDREETPRGPAESEREQKDHNQYRLQLLVWRTRGGP
jgi:hypothetical protein